MDGEQWTEESGLDAYEDDENNSSFFRYNIVPGHGLLEQYIHLLHHTRHPTTYQTNTPTTTDTTAM